VPVSIKPWPQSQKIGKQNIKNILRAKNQKIKVRFEDIKGVTRSRKSKNRQCNDQKISKGKLEVVNWRTENAITKKTTMIYKHYT